MPTGRRQWCNWTNCESFSTDICLKSLNTLERTGLIKMDDGFDLKPTGI